jgi:hypothetical protein
MAGIRDWARAKKGGPMPMPGEQGPGAERRRVVGVEQNEARNLLAHARGQKGSLLPKDAEVLYEKLVRAKRRLEGHADEAASNQLSRDITDVLTKIVGPAQRGK